MQCDLSVVILAVYCLIMHECIYTCTAYVSTLFLSSCPVVHWEVVLCCLCKSCGSSVYPTCCSDQSGYDRSNKTMAKIQLQFEPDRKNLMTYIYIYVCIWGVSIRTSFSKQLTSSKRNHYAATLFLVIYYKIFSLLRILVYIWWQLHTEHLFSDTALRSVLIVPLNMTGEPGDTDSYAACTVFRTVAFKS